ncbi:bifunctional 5-dehydro-2-deoxygluconokinase/5-dehydro-2-deoxyphosphogluconate aldolase [Elstera cyanobacteriorum]|uniref:bifunctional 5-dehydro-2-deoxygluconokinase/5-dehydro-2- deoxyphosphogluconate aldolase n=1 Tax=Elstera cyanobacteriorum TaxID=2022747 RepID=UPI002354AE26|nr:5-dehydro-2-deoxygluconokinase [Elstera cyanobacteriorum]MCK6444159.1 5-dehydro-2-deoxygluconokinase [Elstera cyanobacteriorum]
MTEPQILDVITLGRASVDLYGQQIGCRLEDTASFAKAVGGCPANIAIGTARLGLRSALITRVGAEAMGGFIREQLAREGVSTQGIVTDPKRLTALVLLGVRDDHQFPLIFYRDNCADMALCADDIDPAFIASAGALVVTGTHLSTDTVRGATLKAIAAAKAAGRKVIFDIDYRPNLWGLAGHDAGESRYIASQRVTAVLQPILPDCDLIVGTEEEFRIAGGTEEVLTALAAVRARSGATLVLKRGPMGCSVYPGAIPTDLDQGVRGAGFPIEVYNVLGAGDAFMSGFLRGWLKGEALETCCTWANACGAFAVSRLLCSPEIPTWAELQFFLTHGSPQKALRKDAALNHIHWATTRRPQPEGLMALAIDHRAQFEELADRLGAPREKIEPFKRLAVAAAAQVAAGREGFGMLLDGTYGRTALFDATAQNFWIGRPVEKPGSRPLTFEIGGDLGSHLIEWPVDQVVKCLCFYHPDDPDDLKTQQEERLLALRDACRRVGREMLVEIIAGKHGVLRDDTIPRVMDRLYDLDIKPDWWKLEPQVSPAAWAKIDTTIRTRDPLCRGVVLLGLEAPEEELLAAFEVAVGSPLVRGFAVGRTIFAAAAEAWLSGQIDDAAAIADMAGRFARLTEAWENLQARKKAA